MNNNSIKRIEVVDFDNIKKHILWINANRVSKINKREYPSKIVKISFAKSRFLKPFHIAPLACLLNEYMAQDYKIQFIDIPHPINEYLESFHFFQFNNKPEFNDFPAPSDKKTLPLWLIEQNAINLYPGRVQKYFEENLFIGKDLYSLSTSLAELLNNVFDHSGSHIPGYTFTQYNSRYNQIVACVCDFGIGIPKKVNLFLKENSMPTLSNPNALLKSIELKFSTKSKPHNKGFGWDTIISIIGALKSKLLIISNNVCYVKFANGEDKLYSFEQYFPGTSVVLYIDTRELTNKEEEESSEIGIF